MQPVAFFRNPCSHGFLLGFLSLFIASSAFADEEFWVLGSFGEKHSAVLQGRHLAKVSGLRVSLHVIEINAGIRYRLLTQVLGGARSVQHLQDQISQSGIDDPWKMTFKHLPELEPIFPEVIDPVVEKIVVEKIVVETIVIETGAAETEVGDVKRDLRNTTVSASEYIAVGSFQTIEGAQAAADAFTPQGQPVSIMRVNIAGVDYHRVLLGPIRPTESRSLLASLAQQNIRGARLLRGSGSSLAQDHAGLADNADNADSAISAQAALVRKSKADQTNPSTKMSDFNLATLKKKTQFNRSSAIDVTSNPGRWRTEIGLEARLFSDPGINDLEEFHGAISIQSEYYKTWNDGDDIFAFVPYVRWDSQDTDRSHVDLRELTWIHVADSFEFRAGIRKVFWGVTESQHLVDIINQTDYVENPDGEEKLGQPMLNVSLSRGWGILDLYLLVGFREREFVGRDGRPRLPVLVDEDLASYESGARAHRTDFAMRWSQYFGELELGLSHFSGTSREPRFGVALAFDSAGQPVDGSLVPIYDVIEQTGLDAQYFIGDWAWKLEAISRSGAGDRYSAATFGFEKTFVGAFSGRSDLAVISEYLFDDRGAEAPVIGEDDLALGFRYTVNNPADTTALLVWLYDLDSDEYLMTLEASSRLGSNWKLILETSIFKSDALAGEDLTRANFPALLDAMSDQETQLGLFRDEDFVKLELI